MRPNLYLSITGTLGEGKTVDETMNGCRGVMLSAALPPDPKYPGRTIVTSGVIGEVSSEIAVSTMETIRRVLGRAGMLKLAMKLAIRPLKTGETKNVTREG